MLSRASLHAAMVPWGYITKFSPLEPRSSRLGALTALGSTEDQSGVPVGAWDGWGAHSGGRRRPSSGPVSTCSQHHFQARSFTFPATELPKQACRLLVTHRKCRRTPRCTSCACERRQAASTLRLDSWRSHALAAGCAKPIEGSRRLRMGCSISSKMLACVPANSGLFISPARNARQLECQSYCAENKQ